MRNYMQTEQEARNLINKNSDFDWFNISGEFKLSEAFIEEFADKVNWDLISSYQKLSESFIRKFADKVSWYNISRSQKLSESFIEEFADKVDWGLISCKQHLSEDFIFKFKDYIDFGYLKRNKKSKITYSLYLKLKNKILITDVKFNYEDIKNLVNMSNIDILKLLEEAPVNTLNYIGRQLG